MVLARSKMNRENSGFKLSSIGECVLFLGSSQTVALLQSGNEIRLLGIGLEMARICKEINQLLPGIAPKAIPYENTRIMFRELMQTQLKFTLVFPKIFKLYHDIWCCEK